MSERLAAQVIQELLNHGVREFCVCPGARNSLFVKLLTKHAGCTYWFEERSAAFFALGKSRASHAPVAIVTTSGTAAGELLPAAMEAHYTGVPLVLLTADRPRHYRGTGAPQTAEQVGLFGPYAHYSQDLADGELCNLASWTKLGPVHLNVCFDDYPSEVREKLSLTLEQFFEKAKNPLVIVSTLKASARAAVTLFLQKLNAPTILEAVSGIRDLPSVKDSSSHDAVLRIGGVPTTRLWRELEKHPQAMPVLSINDVPFSGLSFGSHITMPLHELTFIPPTYHQRAYQKPETTSPLKKLSMLIPEGSLVYLGNSLPIREWDEMASSRHFDVQASRGLNGIDGQLSTFLGLSREDCDNWAILGDLTTLYDMSAPWIVKQLSPRRLKLVVINNGGGKIFEKMFKEPEFQNKHTLHFDHLAAFWGWRYLRWTDVPETFQDTDQPCLIEIVSK